MKKNIIVVVFAACLLIPGIVKVTMSETNDHGVRIPLTHFSPVYAETKRNADDSKAPVMNADDSVIYRVMTVILVIWLGLALYLFMVDRKITRLEKSLDER